MRPIRRTLADSHVSGVAIAVLLLWSITAGVVALWGPITHVVTFVLTAIAIRDVPYTSPGMTIADRVMLINTSSNAFNAVVSFAAAWLLSRWTFGVGPFRSLSRYREALARRNHAG